MPSMPIIANWDEYSAEWLLAESLATPKPAPKPEPAPLWASPAMFAWGKMIGMGYEDFTMAEIAVNSQALEDQPQDRWQLHATAVREAYMLGRAHSPLGLFQMFSWHSKILPHGGVLRQSMPVSVGMGESFAPEPPHKLAVLLKEYVAHVNRTLADGLNDGWANMAALHFEAWRVHYWPDGNKRHARLVSNYVAGWYGYGPINVTLSHKSRYLDALEAGDLPGLAALLRSCEVAKFREVSRS